MPPLEMLALEKLNVSLSLKPKCLGPNYETTGSSPQDRQGDSALDSSSSLAECYCLDNTLVLLCPRS